MEHSDGQNVQLCTCLLYEQYMGVRTIHGPHNPSKHGHEDAESTLSLLHQSEGKSGKVTFWCMWKSPYFGYCPEIHMKSIWHAQKFMCSFIMMKPDEDHHEPRWRSSCPYEDHHEHNNILMFIRDQNVCPEFQVKACGTQDTWHNTIGHPTMAIWAQRLYK